MLQPVETTGADVTMLRELLMEVGRILPDNASTLIVGVMSGAAAKAVYLDADRRRETPVDLTEAAGHLIATFTSELVTRLPRDKAEAVARLLDARQISLAVLVDVLAEHVSLSVLRPNAEPGVLAYVRLRDRTH